MGLPNPDPTSFQANSSRRTTYELNGKVYEGLGARKNGALIIGPGTVADLGKRYGGEIPERYFVATAAHESDFAANEVDYEPPDKNGKVFVSKGLYQISEDEKASTGLVGDLLDPEFSTKVFARLLLRGLKLIKMTVMELYAVAPKYPDIWAYLALYHNEGPGAVRKTIKLYGMDWDAYAARNQGRPIVAYGNDCITGGKWYKDVLKARLKSQDMRSVAA